VAKPLKNKGNGRMTKAGAASRPQLPRSRPRLYQGPLWRDKPRQLALQDEHDALFAPLEPHALGTGVRGLARGPSPGSTGPLVRLERHVGQQDRRSDHIVSTAETGPYAADTAITCVYGRAEGSMGRGGQDNKHFLLQGTRPS
jgi:hypothetical protein